MTVGEPGTVRVTDVPEPRLHDPHDAVVKVTATAICGADLFPIHGMTPGFDDATVLGHEFVGTVADVGTSVENVQVGQRVVCSSTVSDGTSRHCRDGRPTQCERRSLFGYSGVYPRLDGGQAELVRVPMADRCLLPLPDAMGDEQALFLADVLPTGFAAVANSGAGLDDSIVVLGCGPVGLMAVLCASAFGAGTMRWTALPPAESWRPSSAPWRPRPKTPGNSWRPVPGEWARMWSLRRPEPRGPWMPLSA